MMTRWLAIAEWLYGAGTRQRVFEPLAGDCADELRRSGSEWMRWRWRLAFVTALAACAPRALLAGVSIAFVADLAGRTLAVGAVAFGLQWLFGSLPGWRVEEVWPPSLATTMPFLIIPFVARIRVEPLPLHQRRLLILTLIPLAAALAAVVTDGPWNVRAGAAFAVAVLAVFGWRAVDPRHFTSELTRRQWTSAGMVGCSVMVATWPLKLARGMAFDEQYWPGNLFFLVIVGAVTVVLALRQPDASAA